MSDIISESTKPVGRPLILIVNDFKDFTLFIAEVLKEKGYRVAVGYDGRDAIRFSTSLMPDLILLNIVMPDVDGLTALKAIRKNPKTKDIKIVMTSAASHLKDRCSIADGFLTEPIDTEVMFSEILKLIGPPSQERPGDGVQKT